MAIDITPKGLDFIKRKEGYFDKAYLCPAGVWTIGWGSIRWSATQPVRKGDTCTPDQAERLLLREIQRVEDAIEATVKVPLTPGQADCLISLFYNIGIGWLTGGKNQKQATLVKYVNAGKFDLVPTEILKFKNANGKPLKGLIIRRQEEVRELWFGDYDAASPDPVRVIDTDPAETPMPQSVEPAPSSSVKEVVAESWTVKGAALAFASTVVSGIQQSYDYAFGIAKEAGPEVMSLKTTLSPFDALIKLTPVLLLGLTVAGLTIVIMRRIKAGTEGKVG